MGLFTGLLRARGARQPDALEISMASIKQGDRFLYVGGHPKRFAALAAKVGLTGRALALAPSARVQAALTRAADRQGAIAEVEIAGDAAGSLDGAFDVALLDRSGAAASDTPLTSLAPVLRPGGRILLLEPGTPHGLSALVRRASLLVPEERVVESLGAAGFRNVRLLADREGLRFFEAFR
jgi:hypothetical protein